MAIQSTTTSLRLMPYYIYMVMYMYANSVFVLADTRELIYKSIHQMAALNGLPTIIRLSVTYSTQLSHLFNSHQYLK